MDGPASSRSTSDEPSGAGEDDTLLPPSGAGAFVVDPQLRYVVAQQDTLDPEDPSLASFLGKTVREAVPEREAARIERNYQRALAGETVVDEHTVDGRVFVTRAVPMRDAGGRIVAALAVSYDVTERRRTRALAAELRSRSQRDEFLLTLSDALRPLIDPTQIGRKALELIGRHLGVNRTTYAEFEEEHAVLRASYVDDVPPLPSRFPLSAFGRLPGEAVRQGDAVVVEDVEADPRFAPEVEAYRAAQIRSFAAVMLRKGGRWVAAFGAQSKTPREWSAEQLGLMRDVVERTWEAAQRARAEAALRDSEQRYRSLFDTMTEGFLICRMVRDATGHAVDFRFVEVNTAFERLTGVTRELVKDRLASEVISEDHGWWVRKYAHVVDNGTTERTPRRAVDDDGAVLVRLPDGLGVRLDEAAKTLLVLA